MKNVIGILAAQLLGMSAMAGTLTLTKEAHSGTVAPQYQKSTVCTIAKHADDSVTVSTIHHENNFHPPLIEPKDATFTKDVPNAAVLESLAGDAARAPVAQHPGPIGGGTTSYNLNLGVGAVNPLLVKAGTTVIRENNSEAAKKLRAFADKNCGNISI